MYFNNPSLIIVTELEKKRVYGELDITEKQIQQSIDDLFTWYKMQSHLPKELPDESCLRTLLIANKLSLEKTKSKLDMKYTLRGLTPEFFRFTDFLKSGFRQTTNNSYWVPIPKLTKDLYRVTFFKPYGDSEDFDLTNHFKRSFIVGDCRLRTECCLGDKFVIDLQHFKLAHFKKLNPVVIRKSEIASSKAYGLRIAGIYFLNAPSFIDKILSILKQALKPKIAARIKSFDKIEDMYQDITREILPVEYGGEEKSLDELSDEWCKEIMSEKWQTIFQNDDQLISDESKRAIPCNDEDILGIQGSFRKLDVD